MSSQGCVQRPEKGVIPSGAGVTLQSVMRSPVWVLEVNPGSVQELEEQ